MHSSHSKYPDLSDILARKSSGRRQRATLSFAEKLRILDALKERMAPLIQARKVRGGKRTRSLSPQV
jgi:hypothetical protein